MITLINTYTVPGAARVLYELLLERDSSTNISHRKMPTWREHQQFVESKPYRKWYLVQVDGQFVGACYLTRQNEIGIQLFKAYQGKGYAVEAVNLLITKHKPLKAIPGKRSGRFLANINPQNERSMRLFQKLGFVHIQETYAL
jgi:RimJ/RimL family protein N-acetyltransferase